MVGKTTNFCREFNLIYLPRKKSLFKSAEVDPNKDSSPWAERSERFSRVVPGPLLRTLGACVCALRFSSLIWALLVHISVDNKERCSWVDAQ